MLSRTAILACLCLVMGTMPGLAANLVTDPESKCSTSNPYPQGQESIRWTGGCRDGLLDGPGVLTWYRDGRWTERNEGSFRAGELHGNAVTTFPDGSTIAGTYVDGKRHGEFILARVNDTYSRSLYRDDQLVEEKPLTRDQMRALIAERRREPYRAQPSQVAAAPAPRPTAPAVTYATAPPPTVPPGSARAAVASPAFLPPAPAVSSMTHARAVAPPWSPIANAAAIAAHSPPALVAPRVAQPASAAPAYPPPTYPAPYPTVAAPPPAIGDDMPLPSARRVCTSPGLYPKGAGWCGVVRREHGESIEVEVTNVRLNSLFAIGIAPGECTGNEYVGSSDRGKRIWVPTRCMQ